MDAPTIDDFLNMGLPKWPALTVVGKRVTKEQAEEICVRTEQFWGCNDKEWEQQVFAAYGITPMDEDWSRESMDKHFEDTRRVREELGMLELGYLYNSRIMSAWIGGAKGWCNWDGTIGSNNFNIGKWPSVQEVFEEWTAIAKAFPFLDLTAQLWNGEVGEPEKNPVIEFRVKDGICTMHLPSTQMFTQEGNIGAFMTDIFTGRWDRERGVDITTLRRAIARLRSKAGAGANEASNSTPTTE